MSNFLRRSNLPLNYIDINMPESTYIRDLGTSDDVESCTRHSTQHFPPFPEISLNSARNQTQFIKNPAKNYRTFNKYCKSLQWRVQLSIYIYENENAEPENARLQKMRSEKRRGPIKRGVPVNAEPESAWPQKTQGPTKRFYNQNGITKATRALLAITL